MNGDGPAHIVYADSNGGLYTPSDLRRRCRAEEWRFCLIETHTGRLVFETRPGNLVIVDPLLPWEVPAWADLRIEGHVSTVAEHPGSHPRS